MQKTPTYIGIFGIDCKSSTKQLKSYSKSCIEQVLSKVNSVAVQQDYATFQTTFTPPKDNHHITTLFIGNNNKNLKSQKHNEMLKTFKYDIKIDIKIIFCVYVPGILLVGYSPETGGIECDNAHPHVTLFLGGGTKAVESNAVIEQLFAQCPNIAKQQFMIKQLQAKYNGHSIYVIKKEVIIGGVTGDNFKNGHRK